MRLLVKVSNQTRIDTDNRLAPGRFGRKVRHNATVYSLVYATDRLCTHDRTLRLTRNAFIDEATLPALPNVDHHSGSRPRLKTKSLSTRPSSTSSAYGFLRGNLASCSTEFTQGLI